jgi:hypothetical protein
MKIIKRSPNGLMVAIGEDERSSKWYHVGKFQEKAKSIPDGGVVTYDANAISGNYHLTFLEAGVVVLPKSDVEKPKDSLTPAPASHQDPPPPRKFDSETSVKQTCAHATGRTLIALQGQLNENNIEAAIEKIYKKFYTLLTQ